MSDPPPERKPELWCMDPWLKGTIAWKVPVEAAQQLLTIPTCTDGSLVGLMEKGQRVAGAAHAPCGDLLAKPPPCEDAHELNRFTMCRARQLAKEGVPNGEALSRAQAEKKTCSS